MRNRFFTLITILFGIAICATTSFANFPFVVKALYFKPIDQPEAPKIIAQLMQQTQEFYNNEMVRHGHGQKTFRLETDNKGNVVVHTVDSNGKSWEYVNNTSDKVVRELPHEFREFHNNIYVVFVGGLDVIENNRCGVGWPIYGRACGGYAFVPTGGCLSMPLVAHELGHAFGLYHDIENPKAVMGIGNDEFNDFETRWLDKHHYFNNIHHINGVPEIIRVYSPKAREIGNKDYVVFNVDTRSINLLHQIQLFRLWDVAIVGWAEIENHRDTAQILVNRNYLTGTDWVTFQILDIQGNHLMHKTRFRMPRIKPEIFTVKNPETDQVIAIEKQIDTNVDTNVEEDIDINDEEELEPENLRVHLKGKKIGLWALMKVR